MTYSFDSAILRHIPHNPTTHMYMTKIRHFIISHCAMLNILFLRSLLHHSFPHLEQSHLPLCRINSGWTYSPLDLPGTRISLTGIPSFRADLQWSFCVAVCWQRRSELSADSGGRYRDMCLCGNIYLFKLLEMNINNTNTVSHQSLTHRNTKTQAQTHCSPGTGTSQA